MNDHLKYLFDSERKRVFAPDSFFTKRVMARLTDGKERSFRDFGIWEALTNSTIPVLGMALLFILSFIAVELFIPQLPQRGMVESFLAPEQNPTESFLYNDTDVPSRPVVLEQLIALEEQE
jgi:hypothetical protein